MKKSGSAAFQSVNSRRSFLKKAALTAAAFYIIPRHVLGRGFIAPSDKLNIAAIGSGGMAAGNIQRAWNNGKSNIVSLCDVDDRQGAEMFNKFPQAHRYKDFRQMLEKEHRHIDAVIIATPDHTHAVATMSAMQHGKHVYTQKPLTHDIYEARMLTRAALHYPKLVTQMGNQGSSHNDTRIVEAIIQSGVLGDIYRINCWTDRPKWPQGIPLPTGAFTVPPTLDWDLWQGTAPERAYNPAFVPFKWRGWWDYGTGALGDMACHIMDTPFRALNLGYPESVQCSIGSVYSDYFIEASNPDSGPPSSTIYFHFPARPGLVPVELCWYDGGILPERPEELLADEAMGADGCGVIYEGTKGKLMTDKWGMNPRLLPTSKMKDFIQPPVKRTFVEGGADGHETQWTEACKAGTPEAVSSPFSQAGPLTETILMGNLAIRSYMYREEITVKTGTGQNQQQFNFPGRKKLIWDGAAMKITNFEPANTYVRRKYREGWPDLTI